MNHIERANQVLAEIKNKNKEAAKDHIQVLLNESASISEHWGAISRLAISIGEYNQAISAAKNYLAINPTDIKRTTQVASIFAESGRLKEAIELATPIAKTSNDISLNHLLGTLHSQVGNVDEANMHLRKALMSNPLLGITWLQLAAMKRFTPDDKELETLNAMEERVLGNDMQNDIPYWFDVGKALLDVGETERAFEKFSHGNKLLKAKVPFDIKSFEKTINQIITLQTSSYFDKLPPVEKTQGKDLIFVIGLPRSGTTLLQQMLTCHPLVTAGGESKNIALALAPYSQEQINDLPNDEHAEKKLRNIANEYQQLMRQRFAESGILLDKSFNINLHLGLLMHIFPAAKFIHLQRNTPETAWSCYRTFFSQGLLWSNDLPTIKSYFDLDKKLLTHWQSIFSDRICTITYEDLVSEPKATLTAMCKSIGLNYDYSFTQFNENKHPVQTASVGQVRGHLSRASVSMPEEIREHFRLFDA